jgi:hypothetical protein
MWGLPKYSGECCAEDSNSGGSAPIWTDQFASDTRASSHYVSKRPLFSQGEFRMKFSRVSAMLKRTLVTVPILMSALYAGDYLWLRFRMSHPEAGPALGTVQFYWATAIKGGREEIFSDQPQMETCARSLFPHLGYKPCWYSSGKTIRVIR